MNWPVHLIWTSIEYIVHLYVFTVLILKITPSPSIVNIRKTTKHHSLMLHKKHKKTPPSDATSPVPHDVCV